MKNSLIACAAALLAASVSVPALADGPAPGTPAPDFTLHDVSYVDHSLSDFRGKVIMLNFWASW